MVRRRAPYTGTFAEAASLAVRKAGWCPHNDLEILHRNGSPRSIRYGYRSDIVRLVDEPALYDQVAQSLNVIGEAGLGSLDSAFFDAVASRVYLQIGSFKVCPYSVFDYHDILDHCADGLRSAGANEPEVARFTVSVTSSFILSVVSGVYSIEGPDPSGFRAGWVVDTIASSLTQEMTLPAATTLHASIQLRLWSDNARLADVLRSRFLHPFDTLPFETDRGVAILLDTFAFTGMGRDGLAWSDDGSIEDLIISELKYDWRSWPIKAFQWAEMVAPYIIEEAERSPRVGDPGGAQSGQRPSDGAHERRRRIASSPTATGPGPLQLERQGGDVAPSVLDPFGERLISDEDFQRHVLQVGIGRGKSPINYCLGFTALDTLYRSRVADVEIASELTQDRGSAFDVAYLTREEMPPGLPAFTTIDWAATRVSSTGTLRLYTKRTPITDETPAQADMAGFPDLLFVVDSSGSMGWKPQPGVGRYDSLLRAVYSVFHFLEQHNKAQYMRFAAVNFSKVTLKTAWHPFSEIRAVKELLFKHQGGGTMLRCSVIRELLGARADTFLCLMITDGRISNEHEVFETVKNTADRGHGFVFIQIGRASPLSQTIQQAGLSVHVIEDHTQLQGLCLEYARTTW